MVEQAGVSRKRILWFSLGLAMIALGVYEIGPYFVSRDMDEIPKMRGRVAQLPSGASPEEINLKLQAYGFESTLIFVSEKQTIQYSKGFEDAFEVVVEKGETYLHSVKRNIAYSPACGYDAHVYSVFRDRRLRESKIYIRKYCL